MTKDELNETIEEALNTTRRDDETISQMFQRLNTEGRIDLLVVVKSVIAILEYLETLKPETKIEYVEVEPEPKKPPKRKAKKK